MQPLFGQGSGIDDPTLAQRQSGFVENWSNSVRFYTFLSTEKEFLHAVFTTMRGFYYRNRKREHESSGLTKRQSAQGVFIVRWDTPETN